MWSLDMPKFQRLTTEYIKTEDRIRICGEISGDTTVTMWLTRPLCSLFLPHLFKIAEKNTPNKSIQHESATVMEIVQQFAQEKAVSSLSPAPTVRPQEQNIEQFIETVEIITDSKILTLRFLSKDSEELGPVILSFDSDQLRQWLYILSKCFRQAEWGMDYWPSWINISHQSKEPPATSH